MSRSRYFRVDIIKELRLRRWARRNYVAPSERRETWHPIVLDEMKRRDRERDFETVHPPPFSAFAPLEPGGMRYLHGSHDLPEEPNVLSSNKPVEYYIHG